MFQNTNWKLKQHLSHQKDLHRLKKSKTITSFLGNYTLCRNANWHQNDISVTKKTNTDSTNQRQSQPSWGIIHCIEYKLKGKQHLSHPKRQTLTQQNKGDCIFLGELQTAKKYKLTA